MDTFFSSIDFCNTYRNNLLQAFSGKGTCFNVEKKSVIVYDGDRHNYVYLIHAGCISHSFLDAQGNTRIVLLLSRGDIFGEVTLLQGDDDKVITRAITPVQLERISKETFFKTLQENPASMKSIMQLHSTKIRILMAEIKDASYCPMKQRLYNLLVRLAHQHGQEEADGLRISYNFTHEDLAQMMASTRSTITRGLAALKKEGKIDIDRHAITVLKKK